MFPFNFRSPETQAMARLFSEVTVVSVVIFLIVAGLVCYSLFRYRARENPKEPPQTAGSKRLELIVTAGPMMLVVALFVVTIRTMAFIDAPLNPSGPPDLIVTGHQWWWEARYPNGAVTANEIHIPYGRRLLVQVESADVIHDFWAPQLARKIDAVPGLSSFVWLRADRPGAYEGACAEFCGTQHAWTRFSVVAEEEASFSAWLKHTSEPAPVPAPGRPAQGASLLQQKGASLFEQKKCGDCHAISGTPATGRSAPDLTHVASRTILGGGISRNTPQNLLQWIANPQMAKPGNHMPDSHLSNEEAEALLAYLEALQ
jgi:cytochrome c oxidase subunit II